MNEGADVLLERVYCPACGAEAPRWKSARGVLTLPAIVPAAEVRSYLNGGLRHFTHDCGQPVLAEMSPVGECRP